MNIIPIDQYLHCTVISIKVLVGLIVIYINKKMENVMDSFYWKKIENKEGDSDSDSDG